MNGLAVHSANGSTSSCHTDTTAAAAAASKLSAAAVGPAKALRHCWSNAAVLPASATESWICYVALVVLLPATLVINALGTPLHWRLVLIAAVPAAVILVLECVYLKVGMGCFGC